MSTLAWRTDSSYGYVCRGDATRYRSDGSIVGSPGRLCCGAGTSDVTYTSVAALNTNRVHRDSTTPLNVAG